MSYYQFTRRCRRGLVDYLRQELSTAQTIFDGIETLEIPSCHVVDSEEYDRRQLPAVVVQNAQGEVQDWAFNQVLRTWEDTEGIYGPKGVHYEVLGGRGAFITRLVCAAYAQEVQQIITDFAGRALALGKEDLLRRYSLLLGNPQLAGDGQFRNIDEEVVWYADIQVPVSADWRALRQRDTIATVVVEELVVQLPDGTDSSVPR